MPKVGEKLVKRLRASIAKTQRDYGSGGGAFDFSRQAAHLQMALECAVPLHFLELEKLEKVLTPDQFAEELSARASKCSHVLGENGDALMFKTKGKTAKAFNRLAEGIACMAFVPGGVTAFGTHWEYKLGRDGETKKAAKL